MKFKYIAVEGNIGSGKTKIANLIAEKFKLKLIDDQIGANPFLEDFYYNREKYAFQTQMCFLLNRYKQQREMQQMELFYKGIITDYFFSKDRIFAQLVLNEEEFGLYSNMYKILRKSVPCPDLIIYLQNKTDNLMKNIKQKGRSFEQMISYDFLEIVNSALNYYFFHCDYTSVFIVNTENVNFIENKAALKELCGNIENFTGQKNFFNYTG